ncbi:uncharacterized protein N7496_005678 [Penicillium cataractarum]|uniref:NAD(P)-binding protein n=1 Tax=Penicillium cataractarum TaxID=2100454 RepID=A0A9W9SIC7_9EURO|nr:uncharacterized protein N7496_005678 [Penicillium cataractarum]KAJ5378269.1 hypothetical protein N7496_005678 [Penicillium cataractarum]
MASTDNPLPSQLTWMVTGCSSGLGKLFIPAVLERGDRIIATARKIDSLREFADHRDVRLLQLDVTASEAEIRRKVTEALSFSGRIDVLVNNAGYVMSSVWEEIQMESLQHQFETNVFGPMRLTQVVLKHMRPRRSGSILFMSSIAGWLGVAGGGPYSASKFALEGAVESLHEEVKQFGIKVHLLVLGQFRTNILGDGRSKFTRPADSLADYDTVVETLRTRQQQTNGKQPGCPKRAVELARDVVRQEGSVLGKTELPLRIFMGSDAIATVRTKCRSTLAILEKYEAIATATDIPGADPVQQYS